MTKHEIAALACKILGIYAIIQAMMILFHFGQTFRYLDYRQPEGISTAWSMIVGLVPFVLLLIFGILLWLLADQLAERMVSASEISDTRSKTNGAYIQAIAFSVVGLFVLAHAIPRAIQLIISLALSSPTMQNPWGLYANRIAQFGALVAQFAIGLWLVFGARGLIGILRITRQVGSKKLENIQE